MLNQIADLVMEAGDQDAFVPKDPLTGRPRPEFDSTVAESSEILREVSTAILIENLGKFSISRSVLAASDRGDFEDILLGYALEIIGIGAAIENMWIAGHARGVEGTFMGDPLIAEAGIRKLLGIENDLAGVLALGLVDEPVVQTREVDVLDPGRVKWHETLMEVVEMKEYQYDVFISYRRGQNLAASLFESELTRAGFRCFRDDVGIPPGDRRRDVIESALNSSRMVLVVINRNFATLRLSDLKDVFAHEIEIALKLHGNGDLDLLPVLVSAVMPHPVDLPGAIQDLVEINAVSVPNPELTHDVEVLVQKVKERLALRAVQVP